MHLESELGCWFSQTTRTELLFLLRRYCEGGGSFKPEKGALSRGGYGSYKAVANEFQAKLMVPSSHRLLTLQKCYRTKVSVFVVFQLCYIIVKFISPKLLSELKMKVLYGIINAYSSSCQPFVCYAQQKGCMRTLPSSFLQLRRGAHEGVNWYGSNKSYILVMAARRRPQFTVRRRESTHEINKMAFEKRENVDEKQVGKQKLNNEKQSFLKKKKGWQTMKKKVLKNIKTSSPLPLLLAHVKWRRKKNINLHPSRSTVKEIKIHK